MGKETGGKNKPASSFPSQKGINSRTQVQQRVSTDVHSKKGKRRCQRTAELERLIHSVCDIYTDIKRQGQWANICPLITEWKLLWVLTSEGGPHGEVVLIDT